MRLIHLLVWVAFLAGTGLADMVVEQKLKSDLTAGREKNSPGDSTMIMSVKGEQARIDLPESKMSSIIDLKTGKLYTVDHGQKKVMVMVIDDIAKAAPAPEESAQSRPAIKKTGKAAKIQGHKCEQYEIIGAGKNPSKIYCWITEEIDGAEMEKFRSLGGKLGGFVGLGGVKHPKGMVMRSEANMNINGRNVKSATEVQSIKRDPVPDSTFAIPPDYQVMEMPRINMPTEQPAQ